MTDRELLELAAKAAGICLHPRDSFKYSYGNWGCDTICGICGEEPGRKWNPLTDDGDALRLAVKLRFRVEVCDGLVSVYRPDVDWQGFDYPPIDVLVTNGDVCAATRRAIVRAAAELGKEIV